MHVLNNGVYHVSIDRDNNFVGHIIIAIGIVHPSWSHQNSDHFAIANQVALGESDHLKVQNSERICLPQENRSSTIPPQTISQHHLQLPTLEDPQEEESRTTKEALLEAELLYKWEATALHRWFRATARRSKSYWQRLYQQFWTLSRTLQKCTIEETAAWVPPKCHWAPRLWPEIELNWYGMKDLISLFAIRSDFRSPVTWCNEKLFGSHSTDEEFIPELWMFTKNELNLILI